MGERGNRSTDRWAFTRADRIGLTALLFVVNGFSLFGWVVAPILSWLRGDPVWTPFISRVTVPELDGAGVAYSVATYDIRVVGPTTGQRIFGLAAGVLWAALLVAGSLIVARLMRSIAEGNAFDRANVGRLRWLAALLLGAVPVAFVVDLFARGALVTDAELGGLPPTASISIPWLPIVAGLVVALIAQAFVAGAALRDDVDGLV